MAQRMLKNISSSLHVETIVVIVTRFSFNNRVIFSDVKNVFFNMTTTTQEQQFPSIVSAATHVIVGTKVATYH